MKVIAVDTGGTFTDFIYEEKGTIKTLKVPSTPHNPSEAILMGLEEIGGEERLILHGTTVATNAFLERKGAKTALITNRGFEDVIEIGRQTRERIYDLHYRKPKPLVPRELRFGIRGRINHLGEVIEDLLPEEISQLAEKLKDLKVESVAVCLLHSYANPEHELKVKEILLKEGDFHVSLSHEVVREFREYERTSTTVINAYLTPGMDRYITHLVSNIRRGDNLLIMQSSGGLLSAEKARKEAVRTILSGPAGGVIGALYLGKTIGRENLITFDMGGTSTDVSLIEGEPVMTTESKVEGFPVKVPMIDIHTIGAGGGSIAWIDEGGALQVGPQSAGADPGPASYGKGGKDFTITDANLYLGRLIPDHFLGGKFKLHPHLLKDPLERLSSALGRDPLEVALSVIETANSNMERALRKVSVERGHDPSEFSLICYGGAGALHACELAKSINIKEVIIPPNPGLFSAFGILCADVIRDYSLTVMLIAEETSTDTLEQLFGTLIQQALADLERDGFKEEEVLFKRSLDMRFKGQSYELNVPFTDDPVGEFHRAHQKRYRYIHERESEIVNIRLRAIVRRPKPPLNKKETKEHKPDYALIGTTKTAFGGEYQETKIYDRALLKPGALIEGPAVVVEYSSTTLVPPQTIAQCDGFMNLRVEV